MKMKMTIPSPSNATGCIKSKIHLKVSYARTFAPKSPKHVLSTITQMIAKNIGFVAFLLLMNSKMNPDMYTTLSKAIIVKIQLKSFFLAVPLRHKLNVNIPKPMQQRIMKIPSNFIPQKRD